MNDLWPVILANITAGSDYKICCLVSKKWHDMIKKIHPKAKTKLANHLNTLLKLFSDRSWEAGWLSQNPNVTWKLFRQIQILHGIGPAYLGIQM